MQAPCDHVEMAGGKTHKLNSRWIAVQCMRDRDGGKRTKFSRQRTRDPTHNGMWIGLKPFKYDTQKGGPRNASVTRHQHTPQCFAAQPSAASLIRDWQAPAADTMVFASEHCPSDAPGPDDENRAVAAIVGANAGGVCIGRNNGPSERLCAQSCGRKFARLGSSCQGQAGCRPGKILGREMGPLETAQRRFEHRGEGFLHAKSDVRSAGLDFGELYA